jgi:hypothetical protein
MLHLNESVWVQTIRKRCGIEKPQWFEVGTGDYDAWISTTKTNHPVGWFLTETLPDWIETAHAVITSPYYNTRYYIRNRFYRKTHVLRTDCPAGEYWDTDERILTGMANAIIDYVEVELAYKHMWCGSDEVPNAIWKDGRCPELGLKYLEWEMDLDNPELDEYNRSDLQANSAREVKLVYDWAKARPTRPDPHEASGWIEYCNKYPHFWKQKQEDVTPEQLTASDTSFKKLREIEQQCEQEDQDMLIRIIKIRKSLWT